MADDDVVPPPSRDLPPTGWMGRDDANNQVVRIHEAARRKAVAGITEFSVPTPLSEGGGSASNSPANPNLTVPPAELALSSEPPSVEVSVSDKIEPSHEGPDVFYTPVVTQVVEAVGDTRRRVEFGQQLLQRPVEIRDAAHVLAQAVKEQITELRAVRRNNTETADFIDFLEMIARELDKLVDALDRAIAAKGSADQQQIFLGEAGKIANHLKTGFYEYLEQHRADIAGYSIKIGLVSAAAWFLHACGFDLASIISLFKK